jgi:hypothetical protein
MLSEMELNSESQPSGTKFAIAAQQLRAELTFRNVQKILAAKGIQVLVLKGPHLGNTVYNSPKERLYGDLDILVKPDDFEKVAAFLLENGFQPFAFDTFTPEIQRDFKHWEFHSPWGILIELHRWLSGHDRYPIDSEDLFKRAEKFIFGETEARGLACEDLLLHLCLHMGTSYFRVIERKHVVDISLLIKKREVDWPVFLRRVKKAGARSIAYYALMAAKLQDDAPVPVDVMRKLCPGRLRCLWLEKNIDPSRFPIYRFPEHSMKKIKRRLLLPLLDRPGQWAGFFWRMTVTKFRWISRVIRRSNPLPNKKIKIK